MTMPSEPTEEELVIATAHGDGEAFGTLYGRYRGPVIGYFLRRVGDPELAFDLAAETFATVIVAASRFKTGGPPVPAWLFGIAHNKLRESLRRGQVEDRARRRLAMEPIAIEDADLLEIEELARTEGEAMQLLQTLPAEIRDAVQARVVDERPYSEIASELQCSEALVRQRVHRGLRRIRHGLKERA